MGVTLSAAVILSEALYAGWHEESPGNGVMIVKTQVFWKHKVIVL